MSSQLKRRLSLLVFLLIGLAVLLWVYSHGAIYINVKGTGEFQYTITSNNGSNTVINSNSTNLSQRVSSGDYTVKVSQSNKNYFATIKVGHWLSRAKLTAVLAPEKQRSYVGDNPANCMIYTTILYSYDCGTAFNSINAHLPASSTLPTYISNIKPNGIEGVVHGFIKTAEGNLLLVQPGDIEGKAPYVIYLVDDSLNPLRQQVLNGLNINTDYAISNYKQGFLIYSSDLSQLVYYASISANSVKIDPAHPSSGDLKPVSLNVNSGHITTVYSEVTGGDPGSQKVQNEILDLSDSGTKKLALTDLAVSSAWWCNNNQICVLAGKKMSVYNLNNNNGIYSLNSVNTLTAIGDTVLAATDKEVLAINTASLAGTVDYSYGDYAFCGLQPAGSGKYLICLKSKGKKAALLIDRSKNNQDSIDKKIQQLSGLTEVDSISAYGKIIYISPKVGSQVYNTNLKAYMPDPDKLKAAKAKINQTINTIGLDKSTYTIIFTR